jgi:hypothetical protein
MKNSIEFKQLNNTVVVLMPLSKVDVKKVHIITDCVKMIVQSKADKMPTVEEFDSMMDKPLDYLKSMHSAIAGAYHEHMKCMV